MLDSMLVRQDTSVKRDTVSQLVSVLRNGPTMYGGRGGGTGDPGIDRWLPLLRQASKKYGVPLNVLTAMLQTESSGNQYATSWAGAQGLMQVMPFNDKSLGITNPFDPKQNVMGGALLFSRYLKASGGDVRNALAMYNAGRLSHGLDRITRVSF
jgi:hypothetical protein